MKSLVCCPIKVFHVRLQFCTWIGRVSDHDLLVPATDYWSRRYYLLRNKKYVYVKRTICFIFVGVRVRQSVSAYYAHCIFMIIYMYTGDYIHMRL